jgi:hypothetical protein
MANTLVSAIITSCNYDLVIGSTDTSRNNELIEYMNRFNLYVLSPLLIQFNSDYGWTEWNTDETVANIRKITLPSRFQKFEFLYLIETEHSGTAASGSSTSVVLDDDASDTDDIYNSYYLRTTGGTGDGQEFVITDYDGDTLTATVSPTITTEFSDDTTFVIYKSPTEDNKLKQLFQEELIGDYSGCIGRPQAYAITAPSSEVSYALLGVTPDDVYVLKGWHYAYPSKLTATTDHLPYAPIFDEYLRQYVVFMAENRDEYDTKVEMQIMDMLQDKITDIIVGRGGRHEKSVPLKGANE